MIFLSSNQNKFVFDSVKRASIIFVLPFTQNLKQMLSYSYTQSHEELQSKINYYAN